MEKRRAGKERYRNDIENLNLVAFPLILQFITNYILGLTDQAIIGRISTEAYGAVGVINSFHFMLLGIAGSTALVFNIRAGKLLAKKWEHEFEQELIAAILLGLVVGGSISAAAFLGKSLVLRNMYGFEGRILKEGMLFFTYICPYSLLQMQLFIFGQYYKVRRRTKRLLVGSLISSVLNIVLDVLFVLGAFGLPRFGTAGAAASTVLAMAVNLLILWFGCRGEIRISFAEIPQYIRIAKEQMKDSVPLMAQELFDGSVFVVILNSLIARIGIIPLNVYLILQQLLKFLFVPMNMYASAVLTLVSQSRNDSDALKSLPRLANLLSAAAYLLLAAVFLVFRNQAAHIITNDRQVIAATSELFAFAVFCYFFQIPAVIYRNALLALEKSVYVLYRTAAVNSVVLLAAAGVILCGNAGLGAVLSCQAVGFLVLFFIYQKKYKALVL